MRNYFVFDNKDFRDFGVYISGRGTFSAPARSYDLVSIPGRSGDLVGFETRLENQEITYPAFICRNFNDNISALRSFLLSRKGYKKLSDSYHTDEYRMAVYVGPFEPEVGENNLIGEFDLVFNCKPQRYLVSGDTVTTLNATGTINNPTLFDSQPLLRIYGAGILGINSESVKITQADVYTDVDCEMMDAYKGNVSKNAYIELSSNDFPVLKPGNNTITLGTGITKVEITPRWWRI